MAKRIKPLRPPDSMYLTAAEGWLGLGDVNAASAELDNITPELRVHPAVLEVRWQIYAKAKRWDACIEIARTLTELVPTDVNNWAHLAYSTRQAKDGGLKPAVVILTGAVDSFPKNPLICYYLACYTAQQKKLVISKTWWDKAMDIAVENKWQTKLRLMATDDPELEPLIKGIWKE
jgi:predicted Zn-dependent protease